MSSLQAAEGVKADKAVSGADTEISDLVKAIERSVKGKRDNESAADGKAGSLRTSTARPKVSSPDLTDAVVGGDTARSSTLHALRKQNKNFCNDHKDTNWCV